MISQEMKTKIAQAVIAKQGPFINVNGHFYKVVEKPAINEDWLTGMEITALTSSMKTPLLAAKQIEIYRENSGDWTHVHTFVMGLF